MAMRNWKETENPKTGEKIVSICSTEGQEFAILRLQKGLEIKEIKRQREGENQAHFTIRIIK